MTFRKRSLALLASALLSLSAHADNSVQRASAASLGAALVAGSVVGWAAHEGSTLTVKAVRASGEGVELILQGASDAVETSAKVAGDVLQSAGVAVGTSVQVVADATGTALVASGKVLAYAANEIGRALLHHEKLQ